MKFIINIKFKSLKWDSIIKKYLDKISCHLYFN